MTNELTREQVRAIADAKARKLGYADAESFMDEHPDGVFVPPCRPAEQELAIVCGIPWGD